VLGLLLLLFAVSYALYYWYESNAQSAAFKLGLAAEEQRDWDGAVDGFTRAGDRRGAEEKEKEARHKVAERDRLYSAGLLAGEKREWHAAIDAFEKVLAIEPSYRDSATRLTEANDEVYKHGLAGLVYLVSGRTAADGLYLRDELGRSARLSGSDARSLLRASSSDGFSLVYDRPRNEADSCDRAPNFSPCRSERVPVLAKWGPGGELTTQALRELDGTDRGTFTRDGLWWYKALPTANSPAPAPVRFYDVKSLKVSEVAGHVEGGQVWALDALRSRVVLAAEKTDGATGITETALYVGGARGEDPRLLRTWPRTSISQVAISPDGRWLVLLSRDAAAFPDSAWLVPLDAGEGEGWRLASLSQADIESGMRLSVAFMPSEEQPSRIVVSLSGRGGETLFAFVPGDGDLTRITSLPTDRKYRRDLSAFSHEGTYLAARVQTADSATLELTGTRQGSEAALANVRLKALDEQVVRVHFSPRDDYILASVQYPDGMRIGRVQKVYAAALGEGGNLSKLHLVCMALLAGRRDMPTLAMPSDGTLLAYISPSRQLRSVFYDGTPGTLVARNVRAVWSLHSLPDAVWLR
jgi:hypothetical protein